MSITQHGILENSKMFFNRSPHNYSFYFHAPSVGHFYCDNNYLVERTAFDSILISYIKKGSFSFITDGREETACSGEIALVDCYKPHKYYTKDGYEAYWLHICGANTYEIYKEIKQKIGCIIPSNTETLASVKKIYSAIKENKQSDKAEISLMIYGLLVMLTAADKADENNPISLSVNYINENYSKNITVDEISKSAHLSSSQFSRNFKKHTGTSPYDYLLSVRLARAKELLKNTNLPISDIAYQTGFASDSNFIYFFRKNEGISPLKFRNTLF